MSLYGVFDNELYLVPPTGSAPEYMLAGACGTKSSTQQVVNSPKREFTIKAFLNTLDFYKDEANRDFYKKIIGFIRRNKISTIKQLQPNVKIGVEYGVYDNMSNLIEGAIKWIGVKPIELAMILLPSGTYGEELHYRRSRKVHGTFNLPIRSNGRYGVLENAPNPAYITIHSIKVYGYPVGTKTQLNMFPSFESVAFRQTSPTVSDITKNAVVLFDSSKFGIDFGVQMFPVGKTVIVNFDVTCILNEFCYAASDDEIINELRFNRPEEVDPGVDDDVCSPFDPIVDRYPTVGDNGGTIVPPCHGECGCIQSPVTGLTPGSGWDSETPFLPDGEDVENPDNTGDGEEHTDPPTGDGENSGNTGNEGDGSSDNGGGNTGTEEPPVTPPTDGGNTGNTGNEGDASGGTTGDGNEGGSPVNPPNGGNTGSETPDKGDTTEPPVNPPSGNKPDIENPGNTGDGNNPTNPETPGTGGEKPNNPSTGDGSEGGNTGTEEPPVTPPTGGEGTEEPETPVTPPATEEGNEGEGSGDNTGDGNVPGGDTEEPPKTDVPDTPGTGDGTDVETPGGNEGSENDGTENAGPTEGGDISGTPSEPGVNPDTGNSTEDSGSTEGGEDGDTGTEEPPVTPPTGGEGTEESETPVTPPSTEEGNEGEGTETPGVPETGDDTNAPTEGDGSGSTGVDETPVEGSEPGTSTNPEGDGGSSEEPVETIITE